MENAGYKTKRLDLALWAKQRSGIALALLVFLIGLANLSPLRPLAAWNEFQTAITAGMVPSLDEFGLLTIIQHGILFLPLGVVLKWHLLNRRRPYSMLLTCGLIFLFALVLELAQAAVSMRHARLTDLLVATAGGMMGGFLITTDESGRLAVHRILARSLLLGNVLLIGILASAQTGADIHDWDCSYPLLLANERTQDRPWQGEIRGLAIYPRALDSATVARLAQLPMSSSYIAVRRQAGARLLYLATDMKDDRIPQRIPGGSPLDLVALPEDRYRLDGDRLEIQGPMLIRSAVAARQICESISKSREFTLETEIASASSNFGTPSRIISNSFSPSLRNFTLGEQQGRLVFRVRTPQNGPNGSIMEMRTDDRVLNGGWQHIIAQYAEGEAKLFVDGKLITPAKRYYTRLPLNKDLSVSVGAVTGLVFFSMGMVTAFAATGRRWRAQWLQCYGACAIAPLIAYALLSFWHQHAADAGFLLALILGPGIGLACGKLLSKSLPRWVKGGMQRN